MVLTREELVSSLQDEVRILLHLAGKVDPAQLDYRPTPTQRSTIELLRYLSVMGPALIASIRSGVFDTTIWQAALADASRLTFDEALAAIGKQTRQDRSADRGVLGRRPALRSPDVLSDRKPRFDYRQHRLVSPHRLSHTVVPVPQSVWT